MKTIRNRDHDGRRWHPKPLWKHPFLRSMELCFSPELNKNGKIKKSV